jgi:2-keto-3-deoxy-6-phosphogluconate aldolase
MTAIDENQRLIAILRGITPDEVNPLVGTLIDSGFTAIEIPLNSPTPFESIARAVDLSGERGGPERLIGAGTVLTAEDVDLLKVRGGNLVVAPNVDRAVIARALELGMRVMPGVMTPTEALAAIDAGARDLKFFPASLLGPDGIKAIRAVIPANVRIYAVGGVGADDFAAYAAAGVYGFGLGSSLFKPGADAGTVRAAAEACIAAISRLKIHTKAR